MPQLCRVQTRAPDTHHPSPINAATSSHTPHESRRVKPPAPRIRQKDQERRGKTKNKKGENIYIYINIKKNVKRNKNRLIPLQSCSLSLISTRIWRPRYHLFLSFPPLLLKNKILILGFLKIRLLIGIIHLL